MNVLFVCRSNAGRSQIAQAFYNRLSMKNSSVSAGTHVENEGADGERLPDKVNAAMLEAGYDMWEHRRTQLTKDMTKNADKIVVMCDETDLPEYVDKHGVEFWHVPDAKGTTLERHKEVRDKIKAHVEELVKKTG
ncbi:MAG: low molecular weight phosphatase family protein [DPANN group archaeon]|nr:low molecular weight phosphatase family protein [DPANN group archaeon]